MSRIVLGRRRVLFRAVRGVSQGFGATESGIDLGRAQRQVLKGWSAFGIVEIHMVTLTDTQDQDVAFRD